MRTKNQRNTYNAEYYRKRRAAFIQQLGGKCVICGCTENLEFDHIDSSSKKISIAKFMFYNMNKLKEEISKCQLLCHSCHVKKSKQCNDFKWKMTEATARKIRLDYINGDITQEKLASLYNLGQSEISGILRGTRWKECIDDGLQEKIDEKRLYGTLGGTAVDRLDPVTGVVLYTYKSMRDTRKDGFKDNHVAECCKGIAKTHGGYKWRFHKSTK